MTKQLLKTMVAFLAIAAMAIGPAWGQNATTYNVTFSGFGNDQLNTVYEDQSLPLQLTFDAIDISEQLVEVYEAYVDDGAGAEEIGVTYTSGTVTVTINSAFNGTATIIVDDDGNYEAYLYVTVVSNAPAPTPITVRMAEGTVDAANWSIASGNASVPGTQVLENVMSGSQVTATYNGDRKVKSVKAVKYVAEPEAGIVNPVVGQIIGSDGKNYDANATLPTGVTAVAKICYVGSDNGEDAPYNHGLALALSDVSSSFYTWCSQTSATCLGTGHQFDSKADAKGDLAGIANTDALVNNAPAGHTHAAASAARNYNSGTHPTGTSEWFLPSAGQWDKMATAAGGYGTLKTNAGLQSDYYWSSSESSSADKAWYVYSTDGFWTNGYKDNGARVRACLAF